MGGAGAGGGSVLPGVARLGVVVLESVLSRVARLGVAVVESVLLESALSQAVSLMSG